MCGLKDQLREKKRGWSFFHAWFRLTFHSSSSIMGRSLGVPVSAERAFAQPLWGGSAVPSHT